jgi:hypothetical protein
MRKSYANMLSEQHHLSNRHFVLSFVRHIVEVPDRFPNPNDKELYKVFVLGCRLKRELCECGPCVNFAGGMDPDLQICLELLRFGVYHDVLHCFGDSQFAENNCQKVNVSSARRCTALGSTIVRRIGTNDFVLCSLYLDTLFFNCGCYAWHLPTFVVTFVFVPSSRYLS